MTPTTLKIGPHTLSNRVFVAPMAGVTDRPFRQLCKRLGAGYAVSEMAASNPRLWNSVKTSRRIDHDGESEPKAVQIAGADPAMMAEAARHNVDRGAQVIDINMGCPATQGVQRRCRLGADGRRAAGDRDRRGGGARGRGAGHGQTAHRPRAGVAQCGAAGARLRAGRRSDAGGARPHARLRVRRARRVRHDRRSQGGGVDSGGRQRRHRLARKPRATCCAPPAPMR